MAKHTFNKDFDTHNVPKGTLGSLEEGMPENPNKHINIRTDLDDLDTKEKRIFRR